MSQEALAGLRKKIFGAYDDRAASAKDIAALRAEATRLGLNEPAVLRRLDELESEADPRDAAADHVPTEAELRESISQVRALESLKPGAAKLADLLDTLLDDINAMPEKPNA